MNTQANKLQAILGIFAGISITFASFFVFISFIVAETPASAKLSGKDMPPDWSAGVWNHGSYYQWYTIGDNPLIFAAGCIGIIIGLLVGISSAKILSEIENKK